MADSSGPLRAFYRLYFGFWIPTLAWASTWWPLGLMYWMARWLVIAPFRYLRPRYFRAVCGNYARILGLPERHRRVRRLAWAMMFQHAYHWIDFFRWSQLPAARVERAVALVEGWEYFDRARASGRGTLLLTAHMGNPEAGAVALGKRSEPVTVLYWRDRFATAEEFRTRMRARGNVQGIAVDASPLSVVPAMRVLREGGLLAAHGDRDFNDQGWPVEFFGTAARFPAGPFLLAAKTDSVVIPTFILLKPDRRFHVIWEEPLDLAGEEPVRERVSRALSAWVATLERHVRETPEQWYCFYPFWEGASASPDA